MKKIYATFILIFLQAAVTYSQTIFQKTYGGSNAEWGNAVIPLSDGSYIIAGSTNTFGAGNYDFYLLKLNNNGDTLWTKTYGGAQDDIATAAQQTSDGGFIIVGHSSSAPTAGNSDICLVKTDGNGNLLWSKNYGGAETDEGYAVQQTADGGFVIAGNTLSFSGDGTSDGLLIKTNSSGDTAMTRLMRGLFDDWSYSVVQANDGGYLLFGVTTNFGPGIYDLFVQKITTGGFTQWAKAYGGFAFEYGFTLLKTINGYAIAGQTSTFGAGDMDMYLLNLDSSGNVLWSKTYGGNVTDVPYAAAQTTDGGFILGGYTTSFGGHDNYLVRTDNSGNMLWSKTYGGSDDDEIYSVKQTADGGFIAVGHTYSFGAGLSDIYVIKTDSAGNSGCNQASPATIAGTPSTQTVNFTPPSGSGLSVFNPSFTTAGGCSVNTLCLVTGTEQEIEKGNHSSIFPNPATDRVTIANLQFAVSEIEIFNSLGEKISSRKLGAINNEVIFNVSSLARGIYLAKVKGTGEAAIFKFVKE